MQVSNIRIRNSNGTFGEISYKELKDYSYDIIEDNICHGLKLVCQGELTEKDVLDYQKEAIKELKQFLRIVRETEGVIIQMNKTTEMYEIYKEKNHNE